METVEGNEPVQPDSEVNRALKDQLDGSTESNEVVGAEAPASDQVGGQSDDEDNKSMNIAPWLDGDVETKSEITNSGGEAEELEK